MTIADNLHTLRNAITETAIACGRDPSDIKLVAVSKRHSIANIREAMVAKQYLFGENYIQEAQEKVQSIEGAAFHFIGHIQSNKAKTAAELFSMVETVDRYKLAKVLNKHLETLDRDLEILIQVNIGNDPNKSGIAPEKTAELLQQMLSCKLTEEDLFADNENIELSMGMSHDFRIAIEEGATIIRVGTAIFGKRPARN
jgi:pyridoxal phosphate enzyme (YggS family)